MRNFTLILLLMSWTVITHATHPFIPPFDAEYSVYVAGLPAGKGTRHLTYLPNGQVRFEMRSEATGLAALIGDNKIHEYSVFILENNRPRPLEYFYLHQRKSPKQYHILFDWEKKQAVSQTKDAWTLPLEEDVLDRMSYELLFIHELQKGKQHFHYQILNKGKVKTYQPVFVGKEILSTELGELETVKYERIAAQGERRTTLWCASKLHYLPVRVEHLEKGKTITFVLEKINFRK